MELKEMNRHFSFDSTTKDLIPDLLKNSLFTILSLGLYFPWAKNEIREIFISHLHLENNRFQYIGKAKDLVSGQYVIAGIIILINFVPFRLTAFWSIFSLLLAIALPYMIYSNHAYKWSHILFMGNPFHVNKNGLKGYYRVFILHYLYLFLISILTTLLLKTPSSFYRILKLRPDTASLAIFTFSLFLYFIVSLSLIISQRQILWKNTYYGKSRFTYTGEVSLFFILLLKGLILIPITFGLAIPYIAKEFHAYYAESFYFGKFNFKFNINSLELASSWFISFALSLMSLGLLGLWPFYLNAKNYAPHIFYLDQGDMVLDNLYDEREQVKAEAGDWKFSY
jgi:uncharacterized membrane protein YjgN (DUF898 family)